MGERERESEGRGTDCSRLLIDLLETLQSPNERLLTQWRLTTSRAGVSTAESEAGVMNQLVRARVVYSMSVIAVLRSILVRAKATPTECDVLHNALRQLASSSNGSSPPLPATSAATIQRAPSLKTVRSGLDDDAPRITIAASRATSTGPASPPPSSSSLVEEA